MLSRRQLLQSLAASAGTLSALPAWSHPGQSIASTVNRAQIVDFDFDATPYLEKLRKAGVRTIVRNYDRAYSTGIGEVSYQKESKTLTKTELTALKSAGMLVYVIFQHCNHSCANFDMTNPATA